MAKGPSRVLKASGGREAFEIKLRAFLDEQDAAWKQELGTRQATAVGFGLATAGIGVAFVQLLLHDGHEFLIVIAFIAMFGCLIGFLLALTNAREVQDELNRGKRIQAMLARLADDLHPKTPVKALLDLSEAVDSEAESTTYSPYSGATKRYYRHDWLALRWAFADGNLLAIRLTDLVKTKSGSELRREHQLRGHMRLNPALYELKAGKQLQIGHLTLLADEREGAPHLYFWGTLPNVDALFEDLTALYGTLKRKRTAGV